MYVVTQGVILQAVVTQVVVLLRQVVRSQVAILLYILTIDTAVGTIGTPASLHGALAADMPDVKVLYVEFLGFGIGSSVFNQIKDNLHRLCGPATLGELEFFSLSSSADTACEPLVRDASLVFKDILEVLTSVIKSLALDGGSSLICVLEVNTKISSLGRDSCRG